MGGVRPIVLILRVRAGGGARWHTQPSAARADVCVALKVGLLQYRMYAGNPFAKHQNKLPLLCFFENIMTIETSLSWCEKCSTAT